jgi:4-hydroxy-tetrahydrodipicolinate reductase
VSGDRVRVCLAGALGRMGLEIARVASRLEDLVVTAAVERAGHPGLGGDLGAAAGAGPSGVAVVSDLPAAIAAADVVIDLSHPDAAEAIADAAARAGKSLVCGTTGLGEEALAAIARAARTVPVLHAANLSAGVAVLADLVRRAAAALPDYDLEIVELHHRKKADAPSGTALALAGAAKDGRSAPGARLVLGRSGHTGERPAGEIGVHAVRGGGIFGEHRVILAGPNERLELVHTAESRALFAEGALQASLFLAKAKPGRYAMTDVVASIIGE